MRLRKQRDVNVRNTVQGATESPNAIVDALAEPERKVPPVRLVSLKPMPTEEELAAIVVAVEQALVRPTVEENMVEKAETVWKFANRWWQGSRRNRARPNRGF